jgi:hypothetical protein
LKKYDAEPKTLCPSTTPADDSITKPNITSKKRNITSVFPDPDDFISLLYNNFREPVSFFTRFSASLIGSFETICYPEFQVTLTCAGYSAPFSTSNSGQIVSPVRRFARLRDVKKETGSLDIRIFVTIRNFVVAIKKPRTDDFVGDLRIEDSKLLLFESFNQLIGSHPIARGSYDIRFFKTYPEEHLGIFIA